MLFFTFANYSLSLFCGYVCAICLKFFSTIQNYFIADESILSEDPTPAETTHHSSGGLSASASGSGVAAGAGASINAHGHEKQQSQLLILAAVVAIGAVIVTSIIVAGIVVVCRHRPRPPEPQDVRKSMR